MQIEEYLGTIKEYKLIKLLGFGGYSQYL